VKNFQIIILIVFIAAAIFGVLVFSGTIPLGRDESAGQGTVVLWGTLPSALISGALETFNQTHPSFVTNYVEKSPETFDRELLEALASGAGPDLLFLPDELAYGYADKIFPIPYESFPMSAFKNTFAGAGEVFATEEGILALPLAVDPMVMYYNRSILDAEGVINPPASWEELADLAPILTKKDENGRLAKSAVALGQFSNITHAKDILAGLFMQRGNPIVRQVEGAFVSELAGGGYNFAPVLEFYTRFADPLQSVYSWNKSLPASVDSWSAENLAFYMGYASELPTLVSKNPNQNFLAAPFPQISGVNFKLTPAKVTGVAVSRFSKNFNTAFIAASEMATGPFALDISAALRTPPARRDLLAGRPTDSFSPVFYSGALYARSWLDPSPLNTDAIFRNMVEKTLANTLSPEDAITDAGAKMQLLLIRR